MRRIAVLFAGIALVASAAVSGEGTVHRSAKHIPGRYIVVLDPSADSAAVANTVRTFKSAQVHKNYTRGFKGLAVEMSDADAQTLAQDPRVQFVEEDATISAATAGTPWGLDRIDQRSTPLNGSYVSSGTGAGVTVYVVDTGVLSSHVDLAGKVAGGFDAVGDNHGTEDCNGHGTHVAGIIGGTSYGVAPGVSIVPVRALDCNGSGSISSLLAGLDWVIQDHTQLPRPAVVNLSLGGDPSTALDNEVTQVIAAGMTTVVAAGNKNADACTTSPARVAAALTVGASNEADQRASFSNYGTCVDLFAPGTNIVSDSYTSPTATSVSSGTSESAPFVSGVAALTLEKYPSASPATVSQTIVSQATLDALTGLPLGTANRLLFSLIDTLDNSQGDSQLLADPSFDYGTTFWTSDICTVVNPSGCPPDLYDPTYNMMSVPSHSGKNHAAIGGPAAKTFHLTSESVTIPASVKRADLSFYLWVVTKDKKSSADDLMTVDIRNAAGTIIETIGTFSNLNANATYEQRHFDVTKYRGATIRISFTGTQSQGPPTWFFLDDVNVNVWQH